MAAVHAPQVPRPHSPFRRAYRQPAFAQQHKSSSSTSVAQSAAGSSSASTAAQQQQQQSQAGHHSHSHHHSAVDTYYGHEDTAKMAARFVAHTFNCPETLPPAPSLSPANSGSGSAPAPAAAPSIPATLAHFVAYALHRTRLHQSVTFTSLALLHRLKTRFPAARGSSGHRLFLSAFMIASKVCCDDTYSNKSWAVVGQGMFALREVNQMEREMCAYLDWQLNVPKEDLLAFEDEVRRIYSRPGPYSHGVTVKLAHGVGGPTATTGPYIPNEFTQPPNAMAQTQRSQPNAPPLVPLESAGKPEKKATSPPRAHQLPTPTETGAAAVPSFARGGEKPQLNVVIAIPPMHKAKPTLPSPPTSPEDADPATGGASPSPASSEEPDLPTPPNSAGAAMQRGASGPGAYKIAKSYSLPGFAQGFGGLSASAAHAQLQHAAIAPVSIQVHRAVMPPMPNVPMPGQGGAVKEVSAVHAAPAEFGRYPSAGSGSGSEEDGDGDALMGALDDEKRFGTAYYASAVPVSSASQAAAAQRTASSRNAVKEKERIREHMSSNREREHTRERRNLRTYTVPCTW